MCLVCLGCGLVARRRLRCRACFDMACKGVGAAMSIKKVVDVKDPLLKIVADVESGRLGVVQASCKILDALRDKGLLYTQPINCRLVGFDPSNRDGEGGVASAIFELATAIAEVGWSWDECAHALCVETAPNDTTVEDFNRVLSTDCGLPPVQGNSIKFGSLSGGHTNYVLRCIQAGVLSECPLLADNGAMSYGKIAARDAEFAKAVTDGLRWTVLRWEVRVLYPSILSILQLARNMSATMLRKESELQGLLRLHTMSAAAMALQRDVNWPGIKKMILRSRPPYGNILDDMISFLIGKSGGMTGKFLKYLQAFHRVCAPAKREALPGAIYSALADCPLQFVSIALMEAAFVCPVGFVSNGTCTWLTVADVTGVSKPKDDDAKKKVSAAEAMLVTARKMLPLVGITDDTETSNKLVAALVKLDVAMARFLLGKLAETKVKLNNLRDVGCLFVQALQEAYPDAEKKEEWGLSPEMLGLRAATDVPSGPALPLYNLDAEGRVDDPLAILRSKGFDIGTVVVATAGDNVATTGQGRFLQVAAVQAQHGVHQVQLQLYDPSAKGSKACSATELDDDFVPLLISIKEFFSEWAAVDHKTQVVEHVGWPANRTSRTDLARTLFIKGSILQALGALTILVDRSFELLGRVQIFSKPVRRVVTANAFLAGTLVLLPESTTVKTFCRPSVPTKGRAWRSRSALVPPISST